ncbi:MAG: DinB family protein [Ktedonobacterales bacterium]
MPASETGSASAEAHASLVERLAYTPQRILDAVSGWSEAEIHGARAEGEWSAADILAHVRASDDIMAYRVYAILARDVPPLPAYDERRWAEVAGYARMDFRASLDTFTRRRAELVALLRRIAPEDWERTGTHEVCGPLTLREVVTGLVEHEEEHAGQRIM